MRRLFSSTIPKDGEQQNSNQSPPQSRPQQVSAKICKNRTFATECIWKINGQLFEEFRSSDIGRSFWSDQFSIVFGNGEELSCFLRVYPNGNKPASEGYCNLFVGVNRFPDVSLSKVEASYQIYVPELAWRFANEREFTPKKREIGPPNSRCITLERLQKLDCVTFKIRLSLNSVTDTNLKKIDLSVPPLIDDNGAILINAANAGIVPSANGGSSGDIIDSNMVAASHQTTQQKLDMILDQLSSMNKVISDAVQRSILQSQAEDDELKGDENVCESEDIKRIREWLFETARCGEYWQLFCDEGFDELATVADLTDADLEKLGITKKGHRIKLLRAIQNLRDSGGDNISAQVPLPPNPNIDN